MTFQRIHTYITDRVPQLMPKYNYTIYEWLACGYDVDKDILPAIDHVCKKGTRNIYTFNWFTSAIKWHHAKRLQKPEIKEAPKEQRDEIRAKNIRWHRDRGICSTSIGPQDYAWLDNYERRQNT